MAKICPRCTADTEALEEETSRDFCAHEKAVIVSVAAAASYGGLVAAGII